MTSLLTIRSLQCPGVRCSSSSSLSCPRHCPLDRAPVYLGFLSCSGRKWVMTEVETSGWKEALGLADALNHSCADPCCPGELRRAVSAGPCGVGFQGPEFQKECGRLDSGRREARRRERTATPGGRSSGAGVSKAPAGPEGAWGGFGTDTATAQPLCSGHCDHSAPV